MGERETRGERLERKGEGGGSEGEGKVSQRIRLTAGNLGELKMS